MVMVRIFCCVSVCRAGVVFFFMVPNCETVFFRKYAILTIVCFRRARGCIARDRVDVQVDELVEYFTRDVEDIDALHFTLRVAVLT